MNQLLLDLPLTRTRDMLLARQRGRQIAGLLGFPPEQQTRIAAAVFEIAVTTKHEASLRFQMTDRVFQVVAVPVAALRLEVELPATADKLDRADVTWAVEELDRTTPFDVREELRFLNQELLLALHELQAGRTAGEHTYAAAA